MTAATDEEATGTPNDIASLIAAHVTEALHAYEADRDDLLERIVDLRTFRLDESHRRQMEGLRLKSTYNQHAVRTLAALVMNLRDDLKPLLIQIATKRLLLEFAERELEEYKAADARNVEDRRVKGEAGLYVEPAAFADKMFTEFNIDRGAYAALTPTDRGGNRGGVQKAC